MSLRRGSFAWLLANDVRLNWRRFEGMLGSMTRGRTAGVAVAAVVVAHALAWPVALWLGPTLDRLAAGETAPARELLAGALSGAFCWMMAQSLFGTMRILFDRGDLDLLMGSPLPPARIFASKALGVCGNAVASIGVLVLPLVDTIAVGGRPQWLSAYPTLLALGLIATSAALLLGMALFFGLGPRRARVIMQLSGAAIGGGLVLAAQVLMLLPDRIQEPVIAWLAAQRASDGALSQLVGLPAEAVLGHLAAIGALMAAALILFALAVRVLSHRFAQAALTSAGMASPARVRSRAARFTARPAAALRRKEWRLLVRDPGLFAQVSLQIIYTLPLMLVLLKGGHVSLGVAVAPSLVVITAQVAASLAWITVSAEDAPELIASAPITPGAADRARLSAIAVPVLLILGVPAALLALVSPWAAIVAVALSVGASISTAMINIWHPMPGNRRGVLRRHSQSKLLALIEHVIAILWAIGSVLALLGTLHALIPIALAMAVLLLATPGRWPLLERLSQRLRAGAKRAATAPAR